MTSCIRNAHYKLRRFHRLALRADEPHLTAQRIWAYAYGLRITVVVGGEA
jgi:hypothetical protein